MTEVSKIRIQIPDAPKNLWRRMLRKVTTKDGRRKPNLNMGYWHAFEQKMGDGTMELECADTKKEVSCSTVHCIAGWTTVLTPGGLAFEDKIKNKLDAYLTNEKFHEGLSDYVSGADGETGMAALLILEKAGWNEHVNWRDFVDVTETDGLKLIKRLAKLEGDRARKRKR